MVRPCVARRFDELVVSGLASMYQTSDWSLAPGHHGYQRAGELISGKASTGHVGIGLKRAAGSRLPRLVSEIKRGRRITGPKFTYSAHLILRRRRTGVQPRA